jgi:acetoin utilization protein AcuB
MFVEMWMTPDPVTVAPTATVSEAALLMAHHRIRRLMVVEGGEAEARLVGIVSAGDLARAFPPDLNPASAAVSERSVPAAVTTVMARDVWTVEAGTSLEAAARILQERKIGAVPVVRGPRLVGILTESDVFRACVEMSDPESHGVRVTFELGEDEDVVATMTEICRPYAVRMSAIVTFHHRARRSGERRRLGVVRLPRDVPDALLDDIWRSRHRVLAVIRE